LPVFLPDGVKNIKTESESGMSTKDSLLLHLKTHPGSWVSGESISRDHAVSRSAVWKQIRRLREEGYTIESSTKKGYRLLESPDLLLPQEIRDGLETRVFGKNEIHHFIETDSTNIRARELAEKGAPEGTLVLAEKQTGGRGRKGRNWHSPPRGGIYVSLILRPALSPAESPKITLLTAVALADALTSISPLEFRIKWPNDLLIHGKKIAGILTEMTTEMDRVGYIVVGLGLNVNTRHFPASIAKTATSLCLEAGEMFSRVQLLRVFLTHFEERYTSFIHQGFEPVLNRWKDLSDIIGKPIRVDMIDGALVGTVQDVDADGVLLLKDDAGNIHRIFSGDVILT
ncbi:MAG: biotin--[acetyl-CoA-carboxylase] ligase, partial [Pseudomonadota bacterium]